MGTSDHASTPQRGAKTKRQAPRPQERRVAGSARPDGDRPGTALDDEDWEQKVATAAYYRAQARGFDGGSVEAEDDWFQAEAELRERFGAAENQVENVSHLGGEATNIEKGD